ncbi:hypothetical protein [Stetteria hydrogenophila]
MPGGYSVVEEYYEEFKRAVLVESMGVRVYSIDVYKQLPEGVLECREVLDVGAPARVCYAPLPGGCEAVIVEVPGEGRRELVSLRFAVEAGRDPFKGSISEARSYCLRVLEEALEGGPGRGASGED